MHCLSLSNKLWFMRELFFHTPMTAPPLSAWALNTLLPDSSKDNAVLRETHLEGMHSTSSCIESVSPSINFETQLSSCKLRHVSNDISPIPTAGSTSNENSSIVQNQDKVWITRPSSITSFSTTSPHPTMGTGLTSMYSLLSTMMTMTTMMTTAAKSNSPTDKTKKGALVYKSMVGLSTSCPDPSIYNI